MRLVLAACTLIACASPDPADPLPEDGDPGDGTFAPPDLPPPASPQLALGVPTDATPDDDALIVHEQLALGYSRYLNAANWVSWRTRAADFGPVPRYAGAFYADDTLPADWYHPDGPDLNGSGFDRGHMVRSEERTSTAEANYATFVMTNVLPQRPDLNRGPWFDFERYVQRKVEAGRDAYMFAGPVWPTACATHAPRVAGDGCRDLGRVADPARRIAVPDATWKVVVFVAAGEDPTTASDAYVVAVLMPNVDGIADANWWDYRTKVAAIEAATGYDLPSLE